MAKLKGKHESKKAQATAYKALGKTATNKKRKLQRHLKKHPNDSQGQEALRTGVKRTRKTPNAKNGWVTEGIRNFVKNYSIAFAFQTISYKELATMGKDNYQKVAQVLKLSRTVAKHPPVYKKGKIHPFYVNKFLGLN